MNNLNSINSALLYLNQSLCFYNVRKWKNTIYKFAQNNSLIFLQRSPAFEFLSYFYGQ